LALLSTSCDQLRHDNLDHDQVTGLELFVSYQQLQVAANRFRWHHTGVDQGRTTPPGRLLGVVDQPPVPIPTANSATLSPDVAPHSLLEMLFDRMPMGIAVIDRAFCIQRYNPTWQDYSARYAPAEGDPLQPGVSYFDHLPGSESTVLRLYRRVLAGETIRQFSAMQVSGGSDYLAAVLRGEPTYGNYLPYPQRVVEIKDDPTIPEDVKQRRVALREAFAGALGVPLFAQDQVYGGLVFYYAEAQQFGEEQVQLAMTFAEQMAVAIENARLFQETERRRAVAESLAEILSILNSTRSSQEIFAYVTQRSCELLQADACLLYSVKDGTIFHEAHYNLPEALAALKTGDLYRAQHNLMLLNRQPVAISDAVTHLQGLLAQSDLSPFQRCWYQGLLANFQAYLGIPLVVNDQVFGGLVFYFKTRRAFSDEEIQLAQTVGGQAALAIENALLREQSAQAAILAERSRAGLRA
jgi:GAF domain-containing protein